MGMLMGLAGAVLAAGPGAAGPAPPVRAVVPRVEVGWKGLAGRAAAARAADLERRGLPFPGTMLLGLTDTAARPPVWW